MTSSYKSQDIAFAYPDNWRLDEAEAHAGGGAVTVYSPGGAFWSVRLEAGDLNPYQLIRDAVNAMREEYNDLDAVTVDEVVADQTLVGADMNFYCLDLTNTAQLRIFCQPEKIYVVLCQAEDREFEQIQGVFRAMTTSLIQST